MVLQKRIQDLAKATNSQLRLRRLKICEHERRVVLENLRKCHFCKSWSYVITCRTCGLPLIVANCLARRRSWRCFEHCSSQLQTVSLHWQAGAGLSGQCSQRSLFRMFRQPTSGQGRVHRREQNSILTSKQ